MVIDFKVIYDGSNHLTKTVRYGLLTAKVTQAALEKNVTLINSSYFPFDFFSCYIASGDARPHSELLAQQAVELSLAAEACPAPRAAAAGDAKGSSVCRTAERAALLRSAAFLFCLTQMLPKICDSLRPFLAALAKAKHYIKASPRVGPVGSKQLFFMNNNSTIRR